MTKYHKRLTKPLAVAMLIAVFARTESGRASTEATSSSTDAAAIVDVIRQHYKSAKEPPHFIPLAPGAVKPQGWLRDWARSAAEGITGQLQSRHIVFQKAWTGEEFKSKGSAGKGLRWPLEQSAYWLDGLIRLGYILEDDALKNQAKERLDLVVKGVLNGGETFIWWEPRSVVDVDAGDPRFDKFTRIFNNWAHAHMGRALVSYYRASGNPEILKALTKVYADFPLHPLNKDLWYPHGSATNLDAMLETYSFSGDQRVLKNAVDFATSTPFTDLTREWVNEELPPGHTVLYYEHARIPAVTYPWTGSQEALQASKNVLAQGLMQHGLPVGIASAQEHLMGIGAVRGLETCNVTASQYTNKWMLQVTGEAHYADQMEMAVLNAGPAAISRDYDLACYFQTMNRIENVYPINQLNIEGYDYSKTAGPTLCCIANTTRMIPDYVQHMWMATMDDGLAATLYGPGKVTARVAGNQTISIDTQTSYPFETDLTMVVTADNTIEFPLYLRVPGWCKKPSIKLNGETFPAAVDKLGFVKINRSWSGGDTVNLELSMDVEIKRGKTTPVPDTEYFKRSNRATQITTVKKFGQPFATVHYGPLLFALALPDESPNKGKEDAEWQFALDLKNGNAQREARAVRSDFPIPWKWQIKSPLTITIPACKFDWQASPYKPLPDNTISDCEAMQTLELVPYGCTKFRVSMFPIHE